MMMVGKKGKIAIGAGILAAIGAGVYFMSSGIKKSVVTEDNRTVNQYEGFVKTDVTAIDSKIPEARSRAFELISDKYPDAIDIDMDRSETGHKKTLTGKWAIRAIWWTPR